MRHEKTGAAQAVEPAVPGALPDLIVLGDSHSNALVEGCKAHGLRVEMLRFSGNFWHAGQVSYHPEHGVWISKPKAMQQQIMALRSRLAGRSVISREVPVLASMGYHLGRFVPPFGVSGHVTEARHFDADPEAHYVSQALADAYIGAARGVHVRMARRLAKETRLVIVAPPFCDDGANMRVFHESMTRRMRAVGLTVYDPSRELCAPGAVLDARYVTEDGRHGNVSYGAEVIGRMLAQGVIVRRS